MPKRRKNTPQDAQPGPSGVVARRPPAARAQARAQAQAPVQAPVQVQNPPAQAPAQAPALAPVQVQNPQVQNPQAQGPPAKKSYLDFAAVQRHNPVPSSSRVLCCIHKTWGAPDYTQYQKFDYAMIAMQGERAINHADQVIDSSEIDFISALQVLMEDSLPPSMLGADSVTMEAKFRDIKLVMQGEFTKFTLTPTNPGYDIELEKGAGNSHPVTLVNDNLRAALEEMMETLLTEKRYDMLATNGYRQIRHAMSTLMIYILKPSNITVRTFKTTVKKLNFLMEGYTLNVNDFRKVCEEVLAKCAITHQMWEDLATDFERLIAGSDGAAKALKGRMTLPNLTSLKLILTVCEKIPTFELDGFATQAGEQDRIIRMVAMANATPFVMVASDKADLVQHMKRHTKGELCVQTIMRKGSQYGVPCSSRM